MLLLLPLLCSVLLSGFGANALSYDYTTSIECVASPHKPQYGGGIIRNPELKQGLRGWSTFGDAKLQHRVLGGNEFIAAHSRNQPHASMSQKVYLHKNRIYTLSAWIQVSEGSAQVKAIFKTSNGFKHAGAVIAQSNCWSMLKGGLTPDASGPAEIYFESKNTSVEIWVDSVSLQSFTQQEWRSHQEEAIDKTRKRNVRIKAVDVSGNPIPNATIFIQRRKMRFPIGCEVNKNILNDTAFQNWITSRFTVTTFGDEMKWYSNEGYQQGTESYSTADAMLQFFQENEIPVRGHNVFWEDPNYQPWWVKKLSPAQLAKAAKKRQESVMSRYSGQVIHWDVVNENLHFSFYEDMLGKNFSTEAYITAHDIDKTAIMFLNDYNTLECGTDGSSTPAKYLKKLKEIQKALGNRARLGIGLESHFGGQDPNIGYVRASLDTLGATGLPIWLTELDVQSCPQQAEYLEQIMREAYSHPKVQGIVLWAGRNGDGKCYRMCLTDENFNNLPTGDVVDNLLQEWGGSDFAGMADANGSFEASLFHGDYEVKIAHPAEKTPAIAQSLKVDSSSPSLSTSHGLSQQETFYIRVSA